MTIPASQLLRSLWNIKSGTGFRPQLIVDIGACSGTAGLYGLFTEPEPAYLLIEPLAEFNPKLTNFMKDRRHRIINACLSDRPGMATFKIDPEKKDSSHLVLDCDTATTTSRTIAIPVTTLDMVVNEFAPELGPQPCDIVVKIDVQGAEPKVIDGGLKTLATHNAVIIVEVGTARPDAVMIFSKLAAMGYSLIDAIDFVRFEAAKRVTSQFDAIFARPALTIPR